MSGLVKLPLTPILAKYMAKKIVQEKDEADGVDADNKMFIANLKMEAFRFAGLDMKFEVESGGVSQVLVSRREDLNSNI